MNRIKTAGAFFLAVVIAAGLVYAQNDPAEKTKEMKMGIIDLNRIADNYEKHNNEIEKIKVKAQAIQEELDKLKEKIKGLEQRKQLFEEESDEYDEIMLQIEECKLRAMAMNKRETKKIEGKQVSLVKMLYADIKKAVKEYSKLHGYDLIMVELGDELIGKKLQEVFLEIRMKPVVYAADHLDVTDKVVDYMNTEFKRAGE